MGAVPLAPHLRACGERGEDFATLGGVETVGIEDAEKQCAVAGDGSKYINCKFNLHFLIKFP